MSMSSSLDVQIQEARKKAEDFSRSLEQARKEEMESMHAIEHERQKWTESYDGKVVMIEQLQRELASTVEALHISNTSSVSTHDERKTSSFHEYSHDQSFLAEAMFPSPSPSGGAGNRPLVVHHHHHKQLQGHGHSSQMPPRGHDSHAPLHPPRESNAHYLSPNTPHQQEHQYVSHDEDVENSQSQYIDIILRENTTLKERISTLVGRETEVMKEVTAMKVKVEQATTAWRDSEGKLRFRKEQIQKFDVEREARDKIESDLRDQISKFEMILKANDNKNSYQETRWKEMTTKLATVDERNEALTTQNKEYNEQIIILKAQVEFLKSSSDAKGKSGSAIHSVTQLEEEAVSRKVETASVCSSVSSRHSTTRDIRLDEALQTEEELQLWLDEMKTSTIKLKHPTRTIASNNAGERKEESSVTSNCSGKDVSGVHVIGDDENTERVDDRAHISASESVLNMRQSVSPPRVAWRHSDMSSTDQDDVEESEDEDEVTDNGAKDKERDTDEIPPPPPPLTMDDNQSDRVTLSHASPVITAVKKIVVKQHQTYDDKATEQPSQSSVTKKEVNDHPYAYMFEMLDKDGVGELALMEFIDALGWAHPSVAEMLNLPREAHHSDGSLRKCVFAFNDMDYDNTKKINIYKFLRYVDAIAFREVSKGDHIPPSHLHVQGGNDHDDGEDDGVDRSDHDSDGDALDTSVDIMLDSPRDDADDHIPISSAGILHNYQIPIMVTNDDNNDEDNDDMVEEESHEDISDSQHHYKRPHARAKKVAKTPATRKMRPKPDKKPKPAAKSPAAPVGVKRVKIATTKQTDGPTSSRVRPAGHSIRTMTIPRHVSTAVTPTPSNDPHILNSSRRRPASTGRMKREVTGSGKKPPKHATKPSSGNLVPKRTGNNASKKTKTNKVIDRDSIEVTSVRSSLSLHSLDRQLSSSGDFVRRHLPSPIEQRTTSTKLVRRPIVRNASKYPLQANIHSTISSKHGGCSKPGCTRDHEHEGRGVLKKVSTGGHWK